MDNLETLEIQDDREREVDQLLQESVVFAPNIAPSTVVSSSRTELVSHFGLLKSKNYLLLHSKQEFSRSLKSYAIK
ncbi:unnamed protein product [Strongylus vulgaris]|uniref:Uncharacterized protein n=1 Tax=Strongylus vulgaris TaxID=40348 RepID=A0A3P7JGB5_STRVU|nr:unnamed protein product [Strongylus vulgaris]